MRVTRCVLFRRRIQVIELQANSCNRGDLAVLSLGVLGHLRILDVRPFRSGLQRASGWRIQAQLLNQRPLQQA